MQKRLQKELYGCMQESKPQDKTYRYFVNKNYDTLIKDYSFFGGTRENGIVIIHDDYEIGRE